MLGRRLEMFRGFVPIILTFFTLLLVDSSVSAKQPNIVFILADDYGWNDIGFHGSQQVQTPFMDSLANDGIILNNYYLLPLCTPSRSALMTGRHPVRTGMQYYVIEAGQRLGIPLNYKLLPEYLNDLGYESHIVGKWHLGFFHRKSALMTGRHPVRTGMQYYVIEAGQRLGIPLNYKLLPEYLNDLGYESHIVGKWHLGFFHRNYTPTYRGFKSFYGYYMGHNDYFDHRDKEGPPGQREWWGLDWHHDIDHTLTDVYSDFGQYSARVIANRAGQLITEHDFDSKPLFLYLPFQSVHCANLVDPVQVPDDVEHQFQYIWNNLRRKYVGAVWELDVAVRNVFKSLQLRGVLDNTIIVFSTDNGGAPNNYNNNWSSNFPLRAGKGYYFEGGTRGVGFVWGDVFKKRKGEVSTDLMHVSDWMPTLYDAAGGDVRNLGDIESHSMMDVLTGKSLASPRSELLINLNPVNNSKAIKVGRYKYMLNPYDRWDANYDNWFKAPGSDPDSFEEMYPNTTESQIWCGDVPTDIDTKCHSKLTGLDECIFDIDSDPCEYYNLVDDPDYQDIKEMLLDRVLYWETLQVKPLIPPYDDAGNPKHMDYVWKPWTTDPTIPPNWFEPVKNEL